ncbi:glycosyltransferase [Simiduia sp. 21SJ11W-1]|uniref:glycosyltransferase family 2 protein n=1 Tax=Simiduia sp. 21SJ11W-1 TaxID=2909669 RepID=UPI00209C9ED2|nr:glycosyltransferase [Simiduia sp. 21SJ11W-1]UTA47371.1 glycosyltransferase [Simiduia sp. 21SJ11W-1]
MDSPLVSVIVPAYNAEKYIVETLDSIVAQKYSNWECIVVDDGSTDNTLRLVKEYGDDRFVSLTQPNSGGPARPRNVGIEAARGEYVFIFDSDDIMLPGKIQKTLAALQKYPKAGLFFSNFQEIDEDGSVIKSDFLKGEFDYFHEKVKFKNEPVFIDDALLFDCLVRNNFIGTSSVCIRHELLDQGFRFDEELKNSDDRLMWFNLSKHHGAVFYPKPLHQYRKRGSSISGKGFLGRAESKIKALKKALLLCESKRQGRIIIRQIASDYSSYAYALRKQGDFKESLKAGLESYITQPNTAALIHCLKALLAMMGLKEKRAIGD